MIPHVPCTVCPQGTLQLLLEAPSQGIPGSPQPIPRTHTTACQGCVWAGEEGVWWGTSCCHSPLGGLSLSGLAPLGWVQFVFLCPRIPPLHPICAFSVLVLRNPQCPRLPPILFLRLYFMYGVPPWWSASFQPAAPAGIALCIADRP